MAPSEMKDCPHCQGEKSAESQDKVLFKGQVSKIALAGPIVKAAFWLLVSLLVFLRGQRLVAAIGISADLQLEMNVIAGAILLAAGVRLLVSWLRFRSTLYSITENRLEFEFGILSKTVRNMDLWRIQDITLKAGFIQNLFGLGVLHIKSSDSSDPLLVIGPIPGARKVYDTLKVVQLQADKRRGVVHLEQ